MRQDGMTVSGIGSNNEFNTSTVKKREQKPANSIMGEPSPMPKAAKTDKPTPPVGEVQVQETGETKPMTKAQKQVKEVQEMKKAAEEAMKELENKNRDNEIKESTKNFGQE